MTGVLLKEAGVAGSNGGPFGDGGDGSVRFGYANSPEDWGLADPLNCRLRRNLR
jgi:hypothetical protein